MPKVDALDNGFYALIGMIAALSLIWIVVGIVLFINDFSAEWRYLNREIARTEGDERRYYIHQRRRLWLSLIPFVKY